MDHLTLKNPAGIQVLLLIKEKERDTIGRRRKRHHGDRSRDEFKKAKPPTFDGEVKSRQETKA